MRIGKEQLVDELVERLEKKNLSVFVGAGLSRDSGGPGWADLCKPYLDRLKAGEEKYRDCITGLQYYVTQEKIDPVEFKRDEIAEKFKPVTECRRRHEILARLPIRNYWTTNFDVLLEKSILEANESVVVMKRDDDFVNPARRRDKIVYKLHGDIDFPDDIVILKDDYDRYRKTHGNFILALAHEFTTESVFFVGYGMNDPDINNIMTYVDVENESVVPTHYMIALDAGKDDMFDYKIDELGRKGINVCVISEPGESDGILERVYRKFMARKVLISGSSCGEYGHFSESEAHRMLHDLGYRITERFIGREGFNLISGYGLNVGPHVMEGGAEAVADHNLDFGDRLTIYPFPRVYYSKADEDRDFDLESKYREYREKMIERCGVVFFFFGTKIEKKKVVVASGVIKEFNIAVEQNKYVFPIATGGASDTLAQTVMGDFDRYNSGVPDEVKEKYLGLNAPGVTVDDIVEGVCDIVDMLTETMTD